MNNQQILNTFSFILSSSFVFISAHKAFYRSLPDNRSPAFPFPSPSKEPRFCALSPCIIVPTMFPIADKPLKLSLPSPMFCRTEDAKCSNGLSSSVWPPSVGMVNIWHSRTVSKLRSFFLFPKIDII